LKIEKLIVTGLGTGYSPVAPGTAGAILGIFLLYFLNKLLAMQHMAKSLEYLFYLSAIILITLAGVYAIKKVHKIWPHDDNKIVIDEIAGVWITACCLPLNWQYYLWALILFRFFDIIKPLGIKKFDQMHNDWSVMLDDLLAGLYGFIVLQGLIHFNII